MSQIPISLFEGVEILPKLSESHVIKYLKKYCTIDTLGDTIYVKRLGNDGTTYAIHFEYDEIIFIKKINDSAGNNIDEVLFDRMESENYSEDKDLFEDNSNEF